MPFFLGETIVRRLKQFLSIFLFLVFVFLGLWLAQDNSQRVEVTLFGFTAGELTLGIALLVAFALGVVVTLCATLPVTLRLGRARKALDRHRAASKYE